MELDLVPKVCDEYEWKESDKTSVIKYNMWSVDMFPRVQFVIIINGSRTGLKRHWRQNIIWINAYSHLHIMAKYCLRPLNDITYLRKYWIYSIFNSLRPRQNRRHFADDVFKCNFLNEKKTLEFRFKFHWRLFLKVQLTIFQHWFR